MRWSLTMLRINGILMVVMLRCIFCPFAHAMATEPGSEPYLLVARSCGGLKAALEKTWPARDIIIDEDINCNEEDWGSPITLFNDQLIRGIRTRANTLPVIDFGDMRANIIVSGAKLVLQTLSVRTSGGHEDENVLGPLPPSAILVQNNGTLDFIGSWVCCMECGIQSKITRQHRPVDPNLIPHAVPSNVDQNSATGQPSLLGDGDYIKWEDGTFVTGGIYHICSSAFSCKADSQTYSAFLYSVDESIRVCQSSPTIVVLRQDIHRQPRAPMTVLILAIAIPSFCCLLLAALLAVLLWRSHVRGRRNYADFFDSASQQPVMPSMDRPPLQGASQNTGVKTDCSGEADAVDQYQERTTIVSFNGIKVDLAKSLGRGGYSTVYQGTFEGNLAAIKVVEHDHRMRAGSSGELAEVQLHRGLYHPYIVVTYCSKIVPVDALPPSYGLCNTPTISVGASDSRSSGKITEPSPKRSNRELHRAGPPENMCTLIVMEYCEKGNLFEAIHSGEFFRRDVKGVPDFVVILRCALDVAAAMRYLHSKGIVHGDLKPENVLRKALSSDERGYICKVGDFGLSRAVPINTLLQTVTLGTITHMPPELLKDGILCPSTDVYSFGIMLWEMISGGFPFQAMGQHEIILNVVGGSRPRKPQNIPRDMWTLIQDCWHEDHHRRPNFVAILGVLQGALRNILFNSSSANPNTALHPPSAGSHQSTSEGDKSPRSPALSSTSPSATPQASVGNTTQTSGQETWQSFGINDDPVYFGSVEVEGVSRVGLEETLQGELADTANDAWYFHQTEALQTQDVQQVASQVGFENLGAVGQNAPGSSPSESMISPEQAAGTQHGCAAASFPHVSVDLSWRTLYPWDNHGNGTESATDVTTVSTYEQGEHEPAQPRPRNWQTMSGSDL